MNSLTADTALSLYSNLKQRRKKPVKTPTGSQNDCKTSDGKLDADSETMGQRMEAAGLKRKPGMADADRDEDEATRREPLRIVDATAPREIYLNVSDEADDSSEPFPESPHPYSDGVTWCPDPALAVNVKYVRADLSAPAPSEQDAVAWRYRHRDAKGYIVTEQPPDRVKDLHEYEWDALGVISKR